ncbi:hypothetical protein K402DRAFT_35080 [Aulographum hederae CBS 113979]|uniref:CCHC-type domain-containing protein n=1 Tax=Aulographum hederae CBS 113979 TaxID=1176131 RepID=A0A6G1GI30_9PEZI|nr:hypothetical protein K402DRAFT_35080 [Aulographum hederae CBS 113979]
MIKDIASDKDFVASASQFPEHWREGIRFMVAENLQLTIDIAGLQEEAREAADKVSSYFSRVEALNKDNDGLRDQVKKFKSQRDKRREEREEARDEVETLREEIQTLQSRLSLRSKPLRPSIEDDDSGEERLHGRSGSRRPRVHYGRNEVLDTDGREQTRGLLYPPMDRFASASPFHSHSTASSQSRRWPDANVFTGDEEDAVSAFKKWTRDVDNKVTFSNDYEEEYMKIAYAIGRLGGDALGLVEDRADYRDPTCFKTLKELFADLAPHYIGEHAEIAAEMQFQNNDIMKQKNAESFNDFFIRFKKIGAPILPSKNETAKVTRMKMLLSARLQRQIAGTYFATLSELVTACRAAERDFTVLDAMKPRTAVAATSMQNSRTSSASPRAFAKPDTPARPSFTAPTSMRQPVRSATVQNKIRRLGACFNCGVKGHNMRDETAPCRGRPAVPDAVINAKLALLEAELANIDVEPDYEDEEALAAEVTMGPEGGSTDRQDF